MSTTYFVEGNELRAKRGVNVQGLKAGETYIVRQIQRQVTPFGTFCYYGLESTSMKPSNPDRLWIANAHLLLEKV